MTTTAEPRFRRSVSLEPQSLSKDDDSTEQRNFKKSISAEDKIKSNEVKQLQVLLQTMTLDESRIITK